MKKNNLIIIGLIAIIIIMGVSYAAFSQLLNINGSASITSDWNIKITSVTTKNVIGDATKSFEPVVSDTAVTFGTTLSRPGDSITYEVTIANEGTIDAKVGSVEMTESNNPAILFTTSGINENDLLEASNTQTYDVTVTYNPDITTQPTTLSANLTVKLNYVQNN